MKVTAAGWGLTSSHPSSSPDVPHEVQLQVSEWCREKDLCAGGSGKSWWKVRKCLAKIELTIFTDYYSNILRVIAVAPSHSSRGASTLSLVAQSVSKHTTLYFGVWPTKMGKIRGKKCSNIHQISFLLNLSLSLAKNPSFCDFKSIFQFSDVTQTDFKLLKIMIKCRKYA